MAKKTAQVKVRLVSSAGTGTTYYIEKNPKNITEKMKFRKYDPKAKNPTTGKQGMHVDFEEKKMPPHKKN